MYNLELGSNSQPLITSCLAGSLNTCNQTVNLRERTCPARHGTAPKGARPNSAQNTGPEHLPKTNFFCLGRAAGPPRGGHSIFIFGKGLHFWGPGAGKCNPYCSFGAPGLENATPTAVLGPRGWKMQPLLLFWGPGAGKCNPYCWFGYRVSEKQPPPYFLSMRRKKCRQYITFEGLISKNADSTSLLGVAKNADSTSLLSFC